MRLQMEMSSVLYDIWSLYLVTFILKRYIEMAMTHYIIPSISRSFPFSSWPGIQVHQMFQWENSPKVWSWVSHRKLLVWRDSRASQWKPVREKWLIALLLWLLQLKKMMFSIPEDESLWPDIDHFMPLQPQFLAERMWQSSSPNY